MPICPAITLCCHVIRGSYVLLNEFPVQPIIHVFLTLFLHALLKSSYDVPAKKQKEQCFPHYHT